MLLNSAREGDEEAAGRLATLVYGELHRLAESQMRRERPDHTLQPTALVHEAYLRIAATIPLKYENRGHFFAAAARSMREVLLDHARRHQAEKRGGGNALKLDLDSVIFITYERLEECLIIDDLLQRLAKLDARQAQLVELRFFGGLTVEETGEALGVSPKTVKRDWRSAKAWLHQQLEVRPR